MALNLLVVDDSAVMRKMIIKTLNLVGLPIGEVHQAGNGKEGLEVLDAHWIDMAFVDINMPVMGGEEMIERLRENSAWKDLPIIVISTEGSETRIERLEKYGAKFIHKPFSPETVRKIMQDMTGVKGDGEDETDEFDVDLEPQPASTLQEVAERTFEDLAFILTTPEEFSDGNIPGGPTLVTNVVFTGPAEGTLFMSVPQEMLAELADNMLGIEDAPSEEQRHDALKELLNVVCGNLLPVIAGSQAVFDVGAPAQPKSGSVPQTYRQHEPNAIASLLLDSGQANLALFTDGNINIE